jgi:regulatory protein
MSRKGHSAKRPERPGRLRPGAVTEQDTSGPGLSEGLAIAYAAVARKERTAAEMRQLLSDRGLPEDVIVEVMAELEAVGTINDAEFARRFCEDKRELSGWGSERIAEALRQRGVGREEIEAALASEDGSSEIERALSVIEGRGYDLTLERDRARALGLLARRGYESEVAYDAIRRLEAGDWAGR